MEVRGGDMEAGDGRSGHLIMVLIWDIIYR